MRSRPGDEVDGLPEEEFFARYGRPDLSKIRFARWGPGGENWDSFILRACTALDRIIHEYAGKTIVLVCHGGIVDATFLYFFRHEHPGPAAGRVLYAQYCDYPLELGERVGQLPRWRLVRYNDDLHGRDTIQWAAGSPAQGDELRGGADAHRGIVSR